MWNFILAFIVVFIIGMAIRTLVKRNKASKQSAPPAPGPTGQGTFCSKCGVAIEPGAAFCGNCGQKAG
jgi:membrane protease subunit (stomatin/prohibitin family)